MNTAAILFKTGFEFTSVRWREVEWDKGSFNFSLGMFLDQKIKFEDFGSTIKSIRFVNIIVPCELEQFHPNEIIYHRSRHQLGLYWQMDYERVMKSSAVEYKTYLAEFFIAVLEIAKATKRIRDFDYDGFIAAVKSVLPEWLATEREH